MNQESRENLSIFLTLTAMCWPASWLLFGVGPGLHPLWRLVGFYTTVPLVLLLTLAAISSLIEVFLERWIGTKDA